MNHLLVIYLTLIGSTILLTSCDRTRTLNICSPSGQECVTVVTDDKFLYLFNGKEDKIPRSGYLKLDVSKRDLEESLNVCWEHEKYDWEVVITHSEIVENSLDTNRFNFKTELLRKANGAPTEAKFRIKDCATILLKMERSSPPSETTIERIN